MQNSNQEESKDKEKIPSLLHSMIQLSNHDLTFAKSPSKNQQNKFNNLNKNMSQSIQAKIFKNINDDKNEEKSQNDKILNFHDLKIMESTSKSEILKDIHLKEVKEEIENEKEIELLGIKPRIVAPKSNFIKKENYDNINKINSFELYDNQMERNSFKKKKKEWKSWSSQEKELFYEAIANGVNYSSLQKLFKNMNNKIGTKSTEKIRDYYYRALKNVNKLLKSVGETGINGKNRDEVLLALNCYGKMITSSSSKKNVSDLINILNIKSKLDVMKKLNKHPRLFKKTALSLKKLIMRGIKQMRKIKLNEKSQKNNKNKNQPKNMTFKKEYKINNNLNLNEPQMKVIDTDICRKIPYDKFIVRITPYDYESYFKMIESNYSPRIEITVPFNKSLKQIIEILQEKWRGIPKKYKNFSLFMSPLEDLWIPNEITFFSSNENSKAYDLGDIYTGYGCPSTNTLFMQYQWNESPVPKTGQKILTESTSNYLNMLKENIKYDTTREKIKNFNLNSSNQPLHNIHNLQKNLNMDSENPLLTSNFNMSCLHNNISNSLLAQPTICEGSPKDSLNNSQVKVEDFLNSVNESEDEKEKSFVPLEQEYDEFDPLEFLGIYNLNIHNIADNVNSSDGEIDEDFDFILDENYDYVRKDKNEKNNQNMKSGNLMVTKKISSFQSPNKNNKEDFDNYLCDDNDPYKGIDYFSKLRKNNSTQENNCAMNAFTISECHSNLSNNLNNNTNINLRNSTNLNQNQNNNDSQNTENFNKALSFNDLNSKIRSNTLTLNSMTNVNDGKNEKGNKIEINNISEKISYSKEKFLNLNSNTNNNKSLSNLNMKKPSPSTPKRVTRRIPFINNQKTNTIDSSNSNFVNYENPQLLSNKAIVSNESNKDMNNSNIFSFPQNEYNTQLTSILKNINSSVHKEKTQFEKKEEIPIFNGENSNLLNYSNNHIGLFDHESNTNILRNPYNNSMFFNDNMFYSNHLNSMFVRNNEDSMMKVINSSYFRDSRENKIKENNIQTNETSINNSNNQFNLPKNITSNTQQIAFNKPLDTNEKISTVLNKKTKRKKYVKTETNQITNDMQESKLKKKKRTEPINLEEILEESEKTSKTTEYKLEINKNKKKGKDTERKSSNDNNDTNQKNSLSNISIQKPANTQNINISNTNPYIINQNNYFNAFNPGMTSQCPPIGDINNKQRVFVAPGNLISNQGSSNLDIPHPHKFFNPNHNMNYPQYNPIQNIHNPIMDPQYMINYGMMRMPGMYYFPGNPSDQGNFQNSKMKNSK